MKFTSTLLLSLLTLSTAYAFADHDETVVQAPLKNSNEQSLTSTICRTRSHLRWDVCYNRDENENETMKSFKFMNYGGNETVPMGGFGVGRDFEFMFEDLARSDLGLLIWDAPDEIESHSHLKILTFFPREVLPAVRYESDSEKDVVIVTLPTKEEVIFNGKTKEIVGGVLTEGPLKQDSNGYAIKPDVNYQGSGVVIETHAIADWPIGYNEAQANKNAIIKKKGFKNCTVPVKELWYTDDNKGGNVFFNKKYVTDLAFDSYLKKRCNFSMY